MCRKTNASVLAVDERQALETLTRDEKTAGRTLAQLKDRLEQNTHRRNQLNSDLQLQTDRQHEVGARVLCC